MTRKTAIPFAPFEGSQLDDPARPPTPRNLVTLSQEAEAQGRPSTATTARPGTGTRPSTGTTLPPLASVVPSSIASFPPPSLTRPGSNAGRSGRPISSAGLGGILNGHGSPLPPIGTAASSSGFPSLQALSGPGSASGLRLPPPNPNGFGYRPGSRSGSSHGLDSYAYRPGTAPALGPAGTSHYYVGSGSSMGAGWDDDRSFGESPFSFNAPPLSSSGSRKRGISEVDEGDGEHGTSESRPQSRRLTVMELCEPEDSASGRPQSSSGSGGILFTPVRERDVYTAGSRPGTSGTGFIVRGAAGLALGDRDSTSSSGSAAKGFELLTRAAHAAGGTATKVKREGSGPTAFYRANSTSSASSAKSTSPGPATTPSPLSVHAVRPTTSGSFRSSSSPRSPTEPVGREYGYGSHESQHRYPRYGYGSYGSGPGEYGYRGALPTSVASPGSDISAGSPATAGARSPLSPGSASPPSAVSSASVHTWR
ncbi:hypothetical protein D9757_003781 [Collybiopsis confluens]|uniref:Uncharacterized protein n=1 Tax=Collybiopsis confluens TaxID=2823264 RepID=A0A8H5HV53_9AGAR|nr:hypothetical protein D9757_003781 [Collybiopsis confluens]